MKECLVSLVRGYGVIIKAENEDESMRWGEFFIGEEWDLSNSKFRKENKFKIESIEMATNYSIDVQEYEE